MTSRSDSTHGPGSGSVVSRSGTAGPVVGRIRFSPATADDKQRGLLGWVSFSIAGLMLDSVAVRCTRDRRHVLSFPVRHDSKGVQHPLVRPLDAGVRRQIETQVLAALGLSEDPAP